MTSEHWNFAPGAARSWLKTLLQGVCVLAACAVLPASAVAQAQPPAADNPVGAPAADTTQQATRGGRRNQALDPAEFQARMMAGVREQFGVTNDDEWAVILPRLTTVMDLRRATMGGGFGFRGMGGGGRNGTRANLQGAANPDLDALQTAITNNAPDAEIKARMERLREVRKQNEAKLEKAHEDLRAVLTVRQEAVAVMMGLLP
jgi:hypothetical protein